MTTTLDFPDLLRLIDERSAAFRAAVAAAPGLDAPVPSCPEWTVFDLAQHLGEGRRKWAATVAAGPAEAPPDREAWAADAVAPRDRDALLEWLAASAQGLLDALRAAGPEQGCWTWWAESVSPDTAGAVARHQLQEVAVHTYDAELAGGVPPKLPEDVALDGVEEFLTTCVAGSYRWPFEPATLDYQVAGGPAWRLTLTAGGIGLSAADEHPADATVRGTAGELVLWFYGRIPLEALQVGGDRRHFDRLVEWDPDA